MRRPRCALGTNWASSLVESGADWSICWAVMAWLEVLFSVVVAMALLLSLSVGRFGVDFWSLGGRRGAVGVGVGEVPLLSERLASSDVVELWASLVAL